MLNYQIHQLKNGLRLITSALETTEAVTILILVKVGGRYEQARHCGISHFLEHLFFKGSKKYPSAFQISKRLEAMGANYNAFTGEEYTGFYVQTHRKDFEKALDILSDMFLNPVFPEREFEKEKGVILEEANMYRDMPQSFVAIMSQELTFPDSPLGWNLVGSPESVKAISRQDVTRYFQQNYIAGNTTVVVCGKPNRADWHKTIARRFEGQKQGGATAFQPFAEPKIAKKLAQEKRKIDQAHFILSARTFAKTDRRRHALALFAQIMGGGMASRLFRRVREERGWAYYVNSSSSGFADTGAIAFSAGVKQDKLNDSVKVILEEIESIKTKGPTADELKRAKGNLRGRLALSLEDSYEIASFLAVESIYEKNIREIKDIIRSVEAVGAKDIRQVAQDIFRREQMSLAIVGPRRYKADL